VCFCSHGYRFTGGGGARSWKRGGVSERKRKRESDNNYIDIIYIIYINIIIYIKTYEKH
jgi:hypothetical protein